MRLATDEPEYVGQSGGDEKKIGDLEGALAVGQKIVSIPPELPEIFIGLGYIQSDLFQFAPALENFRKGSNWIQGCTMAHFRIWIIRARQGERAEATRELKAVIKEREKIGIL